MQCIPQSARRPSKGDFRLSEDVKRSLVASTTLVVLAYSRNSHINAADLPVLLATVSSALVGTPSRPLYQPQSPAVALRRLVTSDRVFCTECGGSFKLLNRHLRTQHDLTPAAYRAKWGLKSDHPMVAPNYAATRSELAKSFGLGRKPSPKPLTVSTRSARTDQIAGVTVPINVKTR